MRRQREFLALLEMRRDPAFPQRLRDWLLDWNASRPADVEAGLEEFQQARNKMLLAVFAQLRPDQQRRVSERLRWYVDAMRDLSRVRQHADARAAQPAPRPAH
jgi:hypothetical protein